VKFDYKKVVAHWQKFGIFINNILFPSISKNKSKNP
jgi:hypothetical protein